ncbi:MAG TPA: Na+/H+ antiporter subunit E [Gammaproteobacteria bacterium]|jgi:multicomponent Na+:H+ antiporter subunit E
MRHTLSVFVLLVFIWVANSGFFTPLLLSLGLVSIVFVVWLAHRMDVVDEESHPVHMTFRLPGYYCWLLIKIVQANIDVVRHVWRPKLAITPGTAVLTASQHSDMGKTIYANSITLTPGTVALNVEGDQIKVHALTREGLEDLQTGEMDRRVSELE